MVLMENHKFQRIPIKTQEITVFLKSATLHETFVFLGQMDGPEPWDHQNQEISRIPLNSVEFRYLIEITLNFGDFSRIHEKSVFERLGGFLAAPC